MSLKSSFLKRIWQSRLICPAILILAAFLRLYKLDLMSTTADEGIHYLGAMNIALLSHFLPVGLPSLGIRNSALFMYLLAIPYFFHLHPLMGAAFVALINVGAVYMTWRIADCYFGMAAATIAALLFTVAPWSVMYGRNMWPPSCVPFFSLLLIWISLRWLEEGGSSRLFAMLVLGFIVPQVHFSGFCAPVWICITLWYGRGRIRALPVAMGVLVGFATWSPWIYWQHFDNQWTDIRQIVNAAEGSHSLRETFRAVTEYSHTLLHSGNFDYWFAIDAGQLPEYFPRWLLVTLFAVSVAETGIYVIALFWSILPGSDRVLRLHAYWAILPAILLLVIRPNVHPHYLLLAQPVMFILIGAWMSCVYKRASAFVRSVLVLFVLITCTSQLAFLHGWLRFIEDGRPTGQGHFQLSYRHRQKVAEIILEDSKGKLISTAGNFSGHTPAYEFIYNYGQISRGYGDYPRDNQRRYWIDEEQGFEVDHPGWIVEKEWRVGPTRIFRERRVQGGFP